MNVYLDIETIPAQNPAVRTEIEAGITPPANMKKAETIAKWEAEEKLDKVEQEWRRTAFAGDRGEIVCIAWAVDDGDVFSVFRTPANLEGPNREITERHLLWTFFEAMREASERAHGRWPRFIGHNVRDFDLRFLFQRAVILAEPPGCHLPHDAGPSSDRVFDTLEAWAGFRNRISLDRLCRALGVPTKGTELDGEEIDGARVWDFVRDGCIESVAAYCRADVERVRAVHERMEFNVAGRRAGIAA